MEARLDQPSRIFHFILEAFATVSHLLFASGIDVGGDARTVCPEEIDRRDLRLLAHLAPLPVGSERPQPGIARPAVLP